MTPRWQRARAFVLVLCGCGAASVAAPPRPLVGRAPPPVAPAVLGDDAPTTVHARARVAHRGVLRFERAGEVVDDEADAAAVAENGADPVYLVAAQDGARVQLRTDGDDARMLVWVDRADLAPVIVKAQALVEPTTGVHGAVARPGAVAQQLTGAGAMRAIVVDDGVVRASGQVPASAIGTVYEQRREHAPADDGAVKAGASILAQPVVGGPAIATVLADANAHAVAPAAGGWIEVEIDRDALYVRGFVPTAAFEVGSFGFGSGAGSNYGITDTPTLILPAGSCLYARPGGPVVGVNTAERMRYAHDGDQPGWQFVSVSTGWGLVWPAVHFPEVGGKPTGDFDRCPMQPSR